MKTIRFILLLGMVFFCGSQFLNAQNGKSEKAQEVRDLIESGAFNIDVNRAIPLSGRSVVLTSTYGLEIKGDSIYANLPYYGRAYSAPYGGGGGLNFDKPLTDYKVKFDKKKKATIRFSTRSDDDRYEFTIQVFSNGKASVFVQPTNKQSITYDGELQPKKKD